MRRRITGLAKRVARQPWAQPFVRAARPVVDRFRNPGARADARELVSSGIFDAGFYGAQVGQEFATEQAAAVHYVRTRAYRRWSPHPLIALAGVSRANRDAWTSIRGMLKYYTSARGVTREWGPLFDPKAVGGRAQVLAFVRGLTDDTVVPLSRRMAGVSATWGPLRRRALDVARALHAQTKASVDLVAARERVVAVAEQGVVDGVSPHAGWVELGRDLIDWEELAGRLDQRVPGRVSIVIPSFQDYRMTLEAVRSLAEHTADQDIEVIVVDNGSGLGLSHLLATSSGLFPRTRVERLPINYNFALGSNHGVALSTGEFVLFLNNDTYVRQGWLPPLLRKLADPAVRGVQPLLLYPDETIQCAGIEFHADGYLPAVPLAGHPSEDARAVAGLRFEAVTAAALLMRASEVVALRGFDPIFVNGSEDIDLCLRATAAFGGGFAVEPSSIVEHRESRTPGRGLRIQENRRLFLERWWGRFPEPTTASYDALGLEVAHLRPTGGQYPVAQAVVVRPRQQTTDASGASLPRLRWSMKSPAPGGWYGDRWGDTHFIEDLAQCLERRGQEVVSYRRAAQASPATALDDVNVGIRGVFPVVPHPGKLNVLWVISHPDEVTADELRGYDLVYAASVPWAEAASERFGVQVRPLLQATDTRAFTPRERPELPGDDAEVVFVGRTRPDGPRQVVMDAIEAGVDVRVWGDLWERYIPTSHIEAEYIPNEELGGLYQRARVVLSDHHRDMAREGFIANRLFDAVASGARVVSDEVAGIEELFGGAVQVYRTPAELARLTSPEGLREAFPDAAELARISRRVAAEHSFQHRADVILADVLEVWRGRESD